MMGGLKVISDEELKEMINHESYCCDKAKWDRDNISEKKHNKMLDILQELKQRRESDLRPVMKFVNCSFEKHIEKIQEEFFEVLYASRSGLKKSIVEELVDLQMTCETFLAGLGLDAKQRMEARKEVIDKNQAEDITR